MRAAVFLADAAQVDASGKVNALGLGWRSCPSPVPAFTIVIVLDIDWDETNTPHRLTIELLTQDGQPATATGPFGPQPIWFQATAEAGRAVGAVPGTSVRMPFAISIGAGLQLEPGLYQWRVSVEGFPDATATESFNFQLARASGPPPPQQQPPQPPHG